MSDGPGEAHYCGACPECGTFYDFTLMSESPEMLSKPPPVEDADDPCFAPPEPRPFVSDEAVDAILSAVRWACMTVLGLGAMVLVAWLAVAAPGVLGVSVLVVVGLGVVGLMCVAAAY